MGKKKSISQKNTLMTYFTPEKPARTYSNIQNLSTENKDLTSPSISKHKAETADRYMDTETTGNSSDIENEPVRKPKRKRIFTMDSDSDSDCGPSKRFLPGTTKKVSKVELEPLYDSDTECIQDSSYSPPKSFLPQFTKEELDKAKLSQSNSDSEHESDSTSNKSQSQKLQWFGESSPHPLKQSFSSNMKIESQLSFTDLTMPSSSGSDQNESSRHNSPVCQWNFNLTDELLPGQDLLVLSGSSKSDNNSQQWDDAYKKPSNNVDQQLFYHETLNFLSPEEIRDGNSNKPNNPEFDPTTLFVPFDFLNRQTPAMQQWWSLKSINFDTIFLFKVGKFYELYHMDAVIGANVLGIAYMKSSNHVAHVGFPEICYEKMALDLIEVGHSVARVEQMETPDEMNQRLANTPNKNKKGKDKVVRREICQITNKATMLYNSILTTSPKENCNFLLAITEKSNNSNQRRFGICFIETSLGEVNIAEFTDDDCSSRLLAHIAEKPPTLVLVERANSTNQLCNLLEKLQSIKIQKITPQKEFWEAETTVQQLETAVYFKQEETGSFSWPHVLSEMLSDGLPKKEYKLAWRSLGACVWYLRRHAIDIQVMTYQKFSFYHPLDIGESTSSLPQRDHMVLDYVTLHNLKVLDGEQSLLKTVDFCQTAFGRRLIRMWLSRPLADPVKIRERQMALKELKMHYNLVVEGQEALNNLPDLERLMLKLHNFGSKTCATFLPDSRAIFYEACYTKRKITDLITTITAFERVCAVPDKFQGVSNSLLRKITLHPPAGEFVDLRERIAEIKSYINMDQVQSTGILVPKKGMLSQYDEAIQAVKQVETEAELYIIEQRRLLKCPVEWHEEAGKRFYLEIPHKSLKELKLPFYYTVESSRKSGKNPVDRYSTPDTKILLGKIAKAEALVSKAITEYNRIIFEKFNQHYESFHQVVQYLAVIDVLLSFAKFAKEIPYTVNLPCIKSFDECPNLKITGGVHPILGFDDQNFVSNDTDLGANENCVLIVTGPNMGGKSTLMRQVGLITILAHVGSYVPVEACEMSVVDRIFTRVGAYDDMIRNKSTFLVEMSEASMILNHASRHSLMLVDELGRGTSTHEGVAVASAYLRQLQEINCRVVFSTHYHMMVEKYLETPGKNIQLGYMAITSIPSANSDPTDTVTFLYKLLKGVCPKSYGFNVAQSVGMQSKMVTEGGSFSKNMEVAQRVRDAVNTFYHCSRALQLRDYMSNYIDVQLSHEFISLVKK